MKLVPIDIAHKTFSKKMMGYHPEEVTDFLNAVADEMEGLVKERNQLRENLREKELRILEYKERDQVLNNTIETAQKMAERIREDNEREARLIVNDANQKAEIILRDARDSLKNLYAEMSNLKKSKIQIEANLRALLQAHLQLLNEQMAVIPDFSVEDPVKPSTSDPTKDAKPAEETPSIQPSVASSPTSTIPSTGLPPLPQASPATRRVDISPVSSN